MSHSYVVNSGNTPTGIEIQNLSSTLVIDSDASSSADGPGYTNSTSSEFQVGNPFSDPPLPVEARRTDSTVNLGNGNVSTATFDYTITIEDDPDDAEFGITRRAVEQTGIAAISMGTDPVAAEAASSHVGERSYRFVNNTNDTISFNISGLFEAEMTAEFDGADGFARTSGSFGLEFDGTAGTNVAYFPVAPYLTTLDEDDPGAMVSELFLANSGGVEGVFFTGSASAIGNGTDTTASLSAQSRYVFTLTLEGGTSIDMATSFQQFNAVGFTPQPDIPPVPLPASLPLLLAGLGGVAALRRSRRKG